MFLIGKVAEWKQLPKTNMTYAGSDGKSSTGRRDFIIKKILNWFQSPMVVFNDYNKS